VDAAIKVPSDNDHGSPGSFDAASEGRVVLDAIDEQRESVSHDERIAVPPGLQHPGHTS
jgi:hypothetical protein